MDHFRAIYSSRAEAYQRMVAVEDCEHNLSAALHQLIPLAGRRVIDLGSGTGRIPLLLKDSGCELTAVDLYRDMLRENRRVQDATGSTWHLVQADMRRLPFTSAAAGVITAGWAIGHLRAWYPGDWQIQMSLILNEMLRLAEPGGWLIIFETLTTGSVTPAPPTPELAEYYAWLESVWGFTRREIQTDYQFTSVEDAIARTEFFFGSELAGKIRENGWARLPEWTGIWTLRKA